MKRPSKSEIKAAINKLKDKPAFTTGTNEPKQAAYGCAKSERKTKNGY